MKRFHTCVILITIIVISCQKEKGGPDAIPASSTLPVMVKPPNADFKITNMPSSGNVWEGLNLSFDNSSQNADSYYWDFGNGTTSTEKIPSGISLVPCGFTYTISLTVKNKDGQSSTYSAPFLVLCSRGMSFAIHK
ncbi:MAG TPA: hypothetical protein VKB95_13680 [Chitinophagaceae bacterium]|nr:hypothetical protein [Chitinophagaceae bacterium]